ncbi:MFS transporter [Jonesia denitrificans]|uniref:Major facilitator superfamily MFS_1 n=1 Tax=Jonesia denitrificans (strain ATCC 14870 / DSM 20603 / BCRC 15368 / CIP 55.134 / JCM 11481 / NBRC 15587 / NCTC 10816 / Prevot 55134) TaxID=471856 RepID=C7QZ67_JONDD|nr:MFS transporter [Jonesia denitrificans]ACV07975.1 major facilitator superfamily MFS_1 [Jonesia denitrificans DSM 20603]ASE08333.1 MFS transporter [Jonesia denitrificans]QXB42932.1 MFS transporter [Jonesia denitrificans]SQH19950.1 D-galactarate permease [Jonesia denitrificans]
MAVSAPAYSLRRAYVVWGAATAAYIAAVVHRTSLGVAGLEAAARFDVPATTLSMFIVVQLLVYAGAQIPVGMALDKLGARRLIAVGALLMGLGQFGMAFAESVPVALAARVLIGAGDATTFVSVLKIIAAWFPPRRAPLLGQITGQIAQLGQIISAVPFVVLLHGTSWPVAFSVLGIVGFAAFTWVLTWVRDAPAQPPTTAAGVRLRPIDFVPASPDVRPVRGAFRTAGSWLGFWTHMVTAFSFNVFIFLWGYPFLLRGQELSQTQASTLFTVMTLVAMVSGPLIGEYCARHPLRRSWLVFAVTGALVVAWLSVLIPTTPRPLWHLVLFVVTLAVGGPASLIGLDYARTSNPVERLGVGSGLANMGGFVGGFLCIFAVGVALDLVAPAGDYTLADFRVAFSVLAVPFIAATIGVIVMRRATRREYAQRGITVPRVREAWDVYRTRKH